MTVDKQKYEELDKLNLCHKCKKNEQFYGRKHCPECLEKISLSNAKQYGKGSRSLEKIREYHKAYREKHKANGLCIICSKPATHGLYCHEHSIYVKRHEMIRSQKRKRERHERGLIPEYRKEHNLCCYCGEPIDTTKHGRACSKCADIMGKHFPPDRTAWRKIIKTEMAKNS